MARATVETTHKNPGETFRAEPLLAEESWRVRRSRDGQNVLFRVSRETAEQFAAAMNDRAPSPTGDPREGFRP